MGNRLNQWGLISLFGFVVFVCPANTRAQEPPGAWILGTWDVNATHSAIRSDVGKVTFSEEAGVIKWKMTRRSDIAVGGMGRQDLEASGIAKVSGSSVDLEGQYDQATDEKMRGRKIKYFLTRKGDTLLEGLQIGATIKPTVTMQKVTKQ
jgi:hypothetical protein